MLKVKLCDLVDVLDKRTKVFFKVNSDSQRCNFEGTVYDFCKSYFYQVYATSNIRRFEINGKLLQDKTVNIEVDLFE